MVAAVVGFLLALFLTGGNLIDASGTLVIMAGLGWAVRRLCHAGRAKRGL